MDINNIVNYTLYLTNCCMLDCPYCYEKRKREKEGKYKMSQQDILSIINFAKTHQKKGQIIEFSLFGGEPLFFLQDQVFFIIDELKKHFNIDEFKITVMSNGYNLTSELIQKLTGLNWFILISFDGPYDIIKENLTEKAYNRIYNNIINIPEDIRKQHIGVKATMSDSTIIYGKEILQYLTNLKTNIVYLSPTHEIDKEKIDFCLQQIDKDIINTRDGLFLQHKIAINQGLELYFHQHEIFLLGHTFKAKHPRPIGWIYNGKITLSEILIKDLLKDQPGLITGQLYLTPENSQWCNNCPLKDTICSPLSDNKYYSHLASTQCYWYRGIEGVLKKYGIS